MSHVSPQGCRDMSYCNFFDNVAICNGVNKNRDDTMMMLNSLERDIYIYPSALDGDGAALYSYVNVCVLSPNQILTILPLIC